MPTYVNPSMSQWNRTNPWAPAGARQVYQPWRSPNELEMLNSPLTDEQYLGLMSGQVGAKSRKARVAADLQRVRDENAFLDSIQPADTAGVFDAPTDARQARLQALLNRDFIGRELGSKLGLAGEARKDREGFIRQGREMELSKMRNAYANTAADNKRNDLIFAQNTEDRAQNRELKNQQIQANNDYRNTRTGQIDEAFANRVQNQNRNFDFRTEQAGIRNQRADQAVQRNSIQDLIKANAPLGQLDSAITAMMPNLSPGDQEVAKAYMGRRAQAANVISSQADFYNQQVLELAQRAAAASGGTIASHFGDALATIGKEINRNQTARGNLVYDPNTRSIVPNAMFSTGNSYGGGGGGQAYGGGTFQGPPAPSYSMPTPVQPAPRQPQGIDPNDPLGGVTNVIGPLGNSIGRFSGPSGPMEPLAGVGERKNVPSGLRTSYVEGNEYPARDGTVWRYSNGQMIRIR